MPQGEINHVNVITQAGSIGSGVIIAKNLQFRMFAESVADNLRPFVEFGVGPTFVLTTPYDKEFLSAFGSAHNNMAGGGYIGIGANFGTDKSSLVGLNVRYYYARLFSGSVESLIDQPRKDFGEIFLSLSIGAMY